MSRVAVVGAGVSGMAAAQLLREKGAEVLLFEESSRPGGLARTFKIADTRLECFYHHIFLSDETILTAIRESGVADKLLWNVSPMGFYCQGQIWNFGGPVDLLRFKPLGLLDRLRFGASALYFQKKKNWRDLEDRTVREWTERWVGKDVYRLIWEPLLRRKFGPGYETVTAAWLWGRINPRANSRSKGGAQELLGYMEGSFQTFLNAYREHLAKAGVTFHFHHKVTGIRRQGEALAVQAADREFPVDAVVFTGPNDVFLSITEGLGIDESYRRLLGRLRYQAALCTVLELERPLSHIYWLNISDPEIVFGGVIEQTNFVPRETYGGRTVVYIFNYLPWGHPYLTMSRERLLAWYLPSLKKMYPFFEQDMILKSYNFRDMYASPAYLGRYSEMVPPYETPVPGLFLGSMAQIYPEDRNMSNSMIQGRQAAERCLAYLGNRRRGSSGS
jgi:protoporphyrinogen oxidase